VPLCHTLLIKFNALYQKISLMPRRQPQVLEVLGLFERVVLASKSAIEVAFSL
jgi:hypothetical protein